MRILLLYCGRCSCIPPIDSRFIQASLVPHRSLPKSVVVSPSSSSICPFCPSCPLPTIPSPSFLRFLSFSSKKIDIANKPPCKQPVTRYMPQELHPDGPSLLAKLPANTKLPGVWIHMEGILRLPTACRRHVVKSCGMNWTPARMVAKMPRKLAHAWRWFGARKRITLLMTKIKTAFVTQMAVTRSAVR